MGSYLDQVCPFMGVRFIAVNDHYDSADHSGATIELDTAFKTLLNDFYCKDISVKVKTSIRNKCERGEYALGQVPFGYERIPGQKNMIRINEQEAAVVRYIFDLAASGMTSVAIEKRLYNEKVPTYRVMRGVGIGKNVDESDTDLGHNWGSGVIRSILNNRFYLGEFIYNKTEPESVGSKKVIRLPSDRWITIPGHHEAIISEELFERTRGEKAVRSNKRKRPKHPLTGKLCCGGCGYAMVFKPHNQRMPARFECSKHSLLKIETCCTYFRADVLAELVMAMVTKELMKLADLRASKEAVKWAMKERMGALEGKIRAVKRREEELDQETFAAYESYVDGAMDEEEYRKEKARINEAVAECAAQISRYRQDLEASERVYTDNADDLKNVLRHSGIERLTQEVVDDFIKKIRVYRNKTVEIEWVFDPGNTFESEAKLSYDRRDLMTSSFKEI
jgi:hypothetical protein